MLEELRKKKEEMEKNPDKKPKDSKANPELDATISRMLRKEVTITPPEDDSVH